ncbi:hypothetical protein OG562_20435 [Streptomyces sp. NBC_01275]|uniref:hypothetical protein n=1 Tax=Streptomyces sp. NBC_01275 TaxID=2903807 RepID=UPI002258D998|nr:hypothetical protein [Streptomyces sp. NBC_01275]MCX4763294.1 hypothetical protein [Streptomyces sp. NBC_01275]
MAIFLFLLLVALVLGLIGAVADGLLYLLLIGILIFAADIAFFAVRSSRRSHHRPLR